MSEEIPVILIGRKPAMNYVAAVAVQFNSGSTKVLLRARGRAISTAVTTAEIVRRMLPGVEVENISIGTEMVGEPGQERPVSTMEILLVKKA